MRSATTSRAIAVTTYKALAALACVVGCSSSKGGGVSPDGGTVSADGGADGGSYAAFKPDVGQIVNHGGPVIASPKIVTVTWSVDPNAATFEAFGDAIGSSQFWRETAGEYGIGAAASGAKNHVRVMTAPPATIDASALEAWLVQQVADPATSGWPAYDASTIYVVYVPTATTLTPSGPQHAEVAVGANKHVPYVIIDENAHGTDSVVDAATAAASHEIAETATNPEVFSDLAIVDFDAQHLAWQIFQADAEIGDVCERNDDARAKGAADLPFLVQRLWSNRSATAGHNPCIPAPSEPYYNVTPLDLETISVFVDTAPTAQSGLGYRVPIGQKKTIKLGFFSDAPMSAPWTIAAVEGSWFSPASNGRLSIAVDAGSGQNGDTGAITVTANAMSKGAGNAVLVTVTSKAPGMPSHAVPILIGTY